MAEYGIDARAIEKLVYHQSGPLCVFGVSSDMRTLLDSADPRAKLRAGRRLWWSTRR